MSQQESKTQPAEQARLFRTADFDLQMLDGWKFVESESEPDRAIFEAANGQSRLTLSIMYMQRDLTSEEARTIFARIIDHRRTAEVESTDRVRLTAHQIKEGEGFCYSKWGGRDDASKRRTGTLVTLENRKLFTLYVESIGTSDQALDALANEVFGSFKAK